MPSRNDVITDAVKECLREMYLYSTPSITWENFLLENKHWKAENEDNPDKSPKDYSPRPYEFYYLPIEIYKTIQGYYDSAYRISPELSDDIDILISYMKDPIRNKYISEETDENGNRHPAGYRSYEHFESLASIIGEDNFNKVVEYLESAKKFYRWDSDLQKFQFNVMNISPCSNKETVIKNWKEWRNEDIEIDDTKILSNFYGDDENYCK